MSYSRAGFFQWGWLEGRAQKWKVAALTVYLGCILSRMICLSREYARKRVAFGKLLKDHPLHMQTIARMEVRFLGAEFNLLARKEGKRTSAAKEHSQPVCNSQM